MSDEVKCWCRHCGIEVSHSHTGPCPECGKSGKDCKVSLSSTIGIRSSIKVRQKRKGFGKFIYESIHGWFPSGDNKFKKGVEIIRIIDKTKYEYHHTVKDIATGKVTHDEHEPLKNHKTKK